MITLPPVPKEEGSVSPQSLITNIHVIFVYLHRLRIQLINILSVNDFSAVTKSTLLGRGSSSDGAVEEITLGSNLSMSGTTLNATGGGSTTGDTLSPFLLMGA